MELYERPDENDEPFFVDDILGAGQDHEAIQGEISASALEMRAGSLEEMLLLNYMTNVQHHSRLVTLGILNRIGAGQELDAEDTADVRAVTEALEATNPETDPFTSSLFEVGISLEYEANASEDTDEQETLQRRSILARTVAGVATAAAIRWLEPRDSQKGAPEIEVAREAVETAYVLSDEMRTALRTVLNEVAFTMQRQSKKQQ